MRQHCYAHQSQSRVLGLSETTEAAATLAAAESHIAVAASHSCTTTPSLRHDLSIFPEAVRGPTKEVEES